ncbi:MAG TPA: hypothetical protein DDW50_06320 [Firmicutes bacterium]|nr:hypothetical protein [Bacillota bacterium]
MLMEQLQVTAGDVTFEKAVSFYNSGAIKSYSFSDQNGHYQLRAIVKEKNAYGVDINLDLTTSQFKINPYCTCSAGGHQLCEHATAVIYQFLANDLPKLNPARIKSGKPQGIEQLKALNSGPDKQALSYQIGGLDTAGESFQITLTAGEGESIFASHLIDCLGDVNYSPHQREKLLKALNSFDFLVLNYLENNFSSKDLALRAVFLPKSKANLELILSIIENHQAVNHQGQLLKLGDILKPQVYLNGSESCLQFDYDLNEFQFLGILNPELNYVLAGDTLHLIERGGLEQLADNKIIIAPEQLGETLFEILPQLGEKINLELGPEFKLQTLKLQQPEIRIDFGYQKNSNRILCNPMVRIHEQIYQGQDCRQVLTEDFSYQRSNTDPKQWSIIDRQPLQNLLRFLERNKFEYTAGQWQICEQGPLLKFMLNGMENLPVDWQVTTDATFKNFKITPLTLEPQVKVEMKSDIDWFDLQIYYNLGGNTYSHQEILRMLEKTPEGNYIKAGNQWFYIAGATQFDFLERALVDHAQNAGPLRQQSYHLPYLRQLLQEQGITLQGNTLFDQFATDISHEHPITASPVPDTLQGELRSYQKEGYYWLRFLHQYHFGGILADDMGLGKTVQVLTLIKSLKDQSSSLIICPRSLLYNWAAEIEKFYPKTAYLVYYGSPEVRSKLKTSFDKQEIIITTYDIIVSDIDLLADYPFYYCILDEAQQIKNYRTERAQDCKKIKAGFRLVLTGTPIENRLEDLWSLFDFLMPDYLGSQGQFKTAYVETAKRPGSKKLAILKQKIAPFMLRREKATVLPNLPPKVTMIRNVLMSQLQEDTYRSILKEVKQAIISSIANVGLEKSRLTVLSALTKLRQLCDHPSLVLPEVSTGEDSGKIDALMELIDEAVGGYGPAQHKIVVFSQFVRMLQLIRVKLEQAGINYAYLDGSTSDRMERIQYFNNTPEIPVFLISLKAGGVGINLTAADTVIHTDPWWNPMIEEQATDRVYRIGQQKQVMVYKLITVGTVEEKLLQLQNRKKAIFDAMIQNQDEPLTSLAWEDIRELFELDDSCLQSGKNVL